MIDFLVPLNDGTLTNHVSTMKSIISWQSCRCQVLRLLETAAHTVFPAAGMWVTKWTYFNRDRYACLASGFQFRIDCCCSLQVRGCDILHEGSYKSARMVPRYYKCGSPPPKFWTWFFLNRATCKSTFLHPPPTLLPAYIWLRQYWSYTYCSTFCPSYRRHWRYGPV